MKIYTIPIGKSRLDLETLADLSTLAVFVAIGWRIYRASRRDSWRDGFRAGFNAAPVGGRRQPQEEVPA